MTPAKRTVASPGRAHLAAALRELRTKTGLSLAALATRTTYSKSSWDRYLNGRALPPRQAVQELCRLAGEPAGRYVALWEIAESEGSGRGTEPAGPDQQAVVPVPPPPAAPGAPSAPAPGVVPVPGRAPRWRPGSRATVLIAAVCAVVVGGAAAAVVLQADRGDRRSSLRAAPPSASDPPRCRGTACEGQDAMHMNCGDSPDNVATFRTSTGAWIELRHSPECRTGWARTWGTRVGDRLESTAGGATYGTDIRDEVDTAAYVYTLMTVTRPGAVLRACFQPAAQAGKEECFEQRVG
ncbi:helix-turn-helix domain-containing protein [Streptomyces sp. NPDC088387]|uniref:helix-turn-helix domain-containing protein n=1 Tax=Streptomyces sp. NPDC088387 TaxID=3365859 RepID=UPI0037FED67D